MNKGKVDVTAIGVLLALCIIIGLPSCMIVDGIQSRQERADILLGEIDLTELSNKKLMKLSDRHAGLFGDSKTSKVIDIEIARRREGTQCQKPNRNSNL